MRIIISESEKKRILSLIKESIDTTELVNYANEYIDGHSCDKIYTDLVKYQTAVNNGEVSIDEDDKRELDDNLNKIKTYKKFACGVIKTTMKDEFSKQANSNPNSLIESMCWFSKNVYTKTLKACQPSKKETIVQTQKTNNSDTLVIPRIPKIENDVKTNVGDVFEIKQSLKDLEQLRTYITDKVNNELKYKSNPPYSIDCSGINTSYDKNNGNYTISVSLKVSEESKRSWFIGMLGNVGGEVNKSLVIDYKTRYKDEGSIEILECDKTTDINGTIWNETIIIGDRPKNSQLIENRQLK